MAQPLRLEVFEIADFTVGPALLMPEEIEDIRLNAYERGYLAGWEDGGAQQDADEATRRALIEKQVEQLNFTYHDARGHVLKALRPLLAALLDTVVPAAVRALIVPLVVEQLSPLAHAAAEAPITLQIARGSRARFEAALAGQMLPPIDIIETDDLAEGQASFGFSAAETRVDLTHVAEGLARAVERFYLIQSEESHRA